MNSSEVRVAFELSSTSGRGSCVLVNDTPLNGELVPVPGISVEAMGTLNSFLPAPWDQLTVVVVAFSPGDYESEAAAILHWYQQHRGSTARQLVVLGYFPDKVLRRIHTFDQAGLRAVSAGIEEFSREPLDARVYYNIWFGPGLICERGRCSVRWLEPFTMSAILTHQPPGPSV